MKEYKTKTGVTLTVIDGWKDRPEKVAESESLAAINKMRAHLTVFENSFLSMLNMELRREYTATGQIAKVPKGTRIMYEHIKQLKAELAISRLEHDVMFNEEGKAV